ncbi:unknown [Clostridium sp. CAG:417]|nr:unknown [Clostridium sp. CAG:417]
MEVVYNVKYKFKNDDNKSKEELKELFNKKLLNIILKLENQELGLNN